MDPPNWARALGLVWLPIGFVGTPFGYLIARNGPGGHRARIGLAVALTGLLAFMALQFAIG